MINTFIKNWFIDLSISLITTNIKFQFAPKITDLSKYPVGSHIKIVVFIKNKEVILEKCTILSNENGHIFILCEEFTLPLFIKMINGRVISYTGSIFEFNEKILNTK